MGQKTADRHAAFLVHQSLQDIFFYRKVRNRFPFQNRRGRKKDCPVWKIAAPAIIGQHTVVVSFHLNFSVIRDNPCWTFALTYLLHIPQPLGPFSDALLLLESACEDMQIYYKPEVKATASHAHLSSFLRFSAEPTTAPLSPMHLQCRGRLKNYLQYKCINLSCTDVPAALL